MNVARQGYVSLLGRDAGTHTADSTEMVAARARFLASPHFEPLVEALVAEAVDLKAADAPEGAVVDLGCGTGYYLAAVLDALPGRVGIGVDNSKFAARRAARCHERASAIVADIWDQVPLKDGSAALMLNVFAPRNGEEMRRILAPGGRLVVVTPEADHLGELIERFQMISVDPDKEDRLERSLGPLAGRSESRVLRWTMGLGASEVRDLVQMGPSADRMQEADMDQEIERLGDGMNVTASLRVTTLGRDGIEEAE